MIPTKQPEENIERRVHSGWKTDWNQALGPGLLFLFLPRSERGGGGCLEFIRVYPK